MGVGKLRRFLDRAFVVKSDVISFSSSEGEAHFRKKCEICWVLKIAGLPFYTEARFLYNKGRADVLTIVNEEPVAIEIVGSEAQKSIELKKLKYPVRLVQLSVKEKFDLKVLQ